jgi:hypothetical protein
VAYWRRTLSCIGVGLVVGRGLRVGIAVGLGTDAQCTIRVQYLITIALSICLLFRGMKLDVEFGLGVKLGLGGTFGLRHRFGRRLGVGVRGRVGSDAVTDFWSDLCADWESGSGTGEEFNTESESGGLRFGLAEIGVKVEIGVGGSHALGRNQSDLGSDSESDTQPRARVTSRACHGIAFCCRV